jgi:hypothetical protein
MYGKAFEILRDQGFGQQDGGSTKWRKHDSLITLNFR